MHLPIARMIFAHPEEYGSGKSAECKHADKYRFITARKVTQPSCGRRHEEREWQRHDAQQTQNLWQGVKPVYLNNQRADRREDGGAAKTDQERRDIQCEHPSRHAHDCPGSSEAQTDEAESPGRTDPIARKARHQRSDDAGRA